MDIFQEQFRSLLSRRGAPLQSDDVLDLDLSAQNALDAEDSDDGEIAVTSSFWSLLRPAPQDLDGTPQAETPCKFRRLCAAVNQHVAGCVGEQVGLPRSAGTGMQPRTCTMDRALRDGFRMHKDRQQNFATHF